MKMLVLTLTVLGVLLTGSVASAQTLKDAVENMASDIESYLTANEIGDIMVGTFEGPSRSTAGRALRRELEQQLKAMDVTVNNALRNVSGCEIRGRYSVTDLGAESASIVVVEADMATKTGEIEHGFRQKVQSQEIKEANDLVKLLGVTADFVDKVASGTDKAKKKKIQAKLTSARKNPNFHFASDSRVAASKSSPFDIEIVVKRDGKYEPLEIGDLKGFAFAPLQQDDVYGLRVRNRARHDVAVEICIDGINIMSLSEDPGYRKRGVWIIGQGKTGFIAGWHKTNQYVHEFLITAAEDAVATELGSPPADLGTITASFFQASDPNARRVASASNYSGTRSIGTGEGKRKDIESKSVNRKISKDLLASISVRYENPEVTDLPDDAPPGE